MNFSDAVRSALRYWRDYKGRSSRSEYWYWALFSLAMVIGGIRIFVVNPETPVMVGVTLISGFFSCQV